MCLRRRVEIRQEYLTVQRIGQSYHLLTYQRMVSPSAIGNKTGGKRVCCRFQREHAHVERESTSSELETVRVSESPMTVTTAKEIVGKGKPKGSVLNETNAVSDTI